MKLSLLFTALISSVTAVLLVLGHSLELLHTIDFAAHFAQGGTVRNVAILASSQVGSAVIALALTALLLACFALFKKVRELKRRITILATENRKPIDAPPQGPLDETEEIERTVLLSFLGRRTVFKSRRSKRRHKSAG
jgi:hypothetical protein